MNFENKFKAKQIPVMALAVACGAMAVMTPDWRNELQAAGYGVSTSHSGTVCKAYNTKTSESSSSKIGYLPNAVVNLNSRSADVICPLDRATDHADGATANVYVQYPAAVPPSDDSRDSKPKPPARPVTTSCTLHSYTAGGASLGSVAGTTDVTGAIALSLGAGASDATSSYTVTCTLPGGAKARITGITLIEN
jgi:hypothetical protein